MLTWNDLREYADFNKDFVTWAQSEMKAGTTVDQAAAEYKVAEKYKGYAVSANPEFGGPTANLEIVDKELKR